MPAKSQSSYRQTFLNLKLYQPFVEFFRVVYFASLFVDTLTYFLSQEYAENFHKAKIGIMELPYTSEEQLIDIGIPSGPRKRILENIKHLY